MYAYYPYIPYSNMHIHFWLILIAALDALVKKIEELTATLKKAEGATIFLLTWEWYWMNIFRACTWEAR